MTPLDTVLMELIPPIGNAHEVIGSLKRREKFSEMKLAVAHVSNNARPLTRRESQSRTSNVAVVINCGRIAGVIVAKHVVSLSLSRDSHAEPSVFESAASDFVVTLAFLFKCKRVLCRL